MPTWLTSRPKASAGPSSPYKKRRLKCQAPVGYAYFSAAEVLGGFLRVYGVLCQQHPDSGAKKGGKPLRRQGLPGQQQIVRRVEKHHSGSGVPQVCHGFFQRIPQAELAGIRLHTKDALFPAHRHQLHRQELPDVRSPVREAQRRRQERPHKNSFHGCFLRSTGFSRPSRSRSWDTLFRKMPFPSVPSKGAR